MDGGSKEIMHGDYHDVCGLWELFLCYDYPLPITPLLLHISVKATVGWTRFINIVRFMGPLLLQKTKLHELESKILQPGIEPGPVVWETTILPLNYYSESHYQLKSD